MTKQITIKEDGVSKSESVDFINTQVAGGSADWMPEDEAQAGVFYVNANGEYVPSDYGLYGFYAVGVMVPGGNGAETIQPGSLTPTYVTPLPATGLGASVIGVDPTDGAMYRTEIQDVDGVPTLVKTKVADSKQDYKPTSMKILIKPAKLSYNDGDKIQYAGLVVQLLDSTGYTFVDDKFPHGIISWSPVKNLLHPEYNLITPVETAEYSDESSAYSDLSLPDTWTMPITFYKTVTRRYDYHPYEYTQSWTAVGSAAILLWLNHEGGTHASLCCGTGGKIIESKQYDSPEAGDSYVIEIEMNYSKTIDGKTVYYKEFTDDLNPSSYIHATPYVKGQHTTFAGPNGCWTAIYGEITGGGNIPVRWTSPYDNQTYEDRFEIEVSGTDNPSSGSESSGGSSSGGGGGGHSF